MKKIAFIWIMMCSLNLIAQQHLPTVTLKNLKGEIVSTKTDFQNKDKIYVFSFWATWCTPCLQELDAISEVYGDWKNEINVEVIAVSVDDSRTQKRVKPLVNGKGWDYTVLLDTNQELKRSLSIANVPYIVVVKNDEIVHIQNGHTPGGEEELFKILKSL